MLVAIVLAACVTGSESSARRAADAGARACQGTPQHGCAVTCSVGWITYAGMQCEDGWADCNGGAIDGCETHVAADPANCGACGAVAERCTDGVAGGPAERLASCEREPQGLVVDDARVYVACDGELRSIDKASGDVRGIAGGEPHLRGLTASGDRLFWISAPDGAGASIRRVGREGGAVETVADGLNPGPDLVVRGDAVYWVEAGPTSKAPGRLVGTGGGELLANVPRDAHLLAFGDRIYVGGTQAVRFDGTDARSERARSASSRRTGCPSTSSARPATTSFPRRRRPVSCTNWILRGATATGSASPSWCGGRAAARALSSMGWAPYPSRPVASCPRARSAPYSCGST